VPPEVAESVLILVHLCGFFPMLGWLWLREHQNALAGVPAVLTLPESAQGQGDSMTRIKDAASDFLAHNRVAVTGVSRTPGNHGSNVVYKRLRERGYQVFAVNPNANDVEGDPAYRDLHSIPDGVEAVVIGTRPERAEETMRECAELGIKHVWMHRGPGGGSVPQAATAYGRERGISVIDGGCPCMFGVTADPGHRVMRVLFTMTGNVPRQV
jgi:uncharacterized protein